MGSNAALKEGNNVYFWIIVVLSIAIPVAVALLFYIPQTGNLGRLDVSILPHINAVLNSATAIALLSGFSFIRKGNIASHRRAMFTAFLLSSLFLVSYVVYHYKGSHTIFGDTDHDGILETEENSAVASVKYIYYFILLTHILLAIVVVPLVLFAIYFAVTNQIPKHKRIVKFTFPIWLYVAVTGVVVYFLISPYYV